MNTKTSLTLVELVVVMQMARGRSYRQIATSADIDANSVKIAASSAMQKLGLRTSKQLKELAKAQGWLG